VVVQFCHPRRAQDLVTRSCEQTDVVGSLFAPNRKINNQVFSSSRNLQTCLIQLTITTQTTRKYAFASSVKGQKNVKLMSRIKLSDSRRAYILDCHQTAINGPKSMQMQTNGRSRRKRPSY
jgi:hypothetical protein